jgi:hypothetical protein
MGLGPICQSRDGGPDQLTPEEEGTQRSRGDWHVVNRAKPALAVGLGPHPVTDNFLEGGTLTLALSRRRERG